MVLPEGILPLAPALQAKLKSWHYPASLGFGKVQAPIMAQCRFTNGAWSPVELTAFENLALSPACKALHYGQLIFEGLKAYRPSRGDVLLFRPQQNHARLNSSAERMAMPTLPEQAFMQAVQSVAYHLAEHIPQGQDESLYLRPLMLATDEGFGVKPSESYLFLLMASPSGAYFAESEVAALIEREHCRSAPGGTGAAKVAGNYGASLASTRAAQALQYNQTLWLDATEKRFIEEFSGMNFFAVVDGALYTPALNSSILAGVTRDSLLRLAAGLGLAAHEARLDVNELIAAIHEGRCTELFACGTAAVVTPVAMLGEKDGTRFRPRPAASGSVALRLREELTARQLGRKPAPAGWLVRIPRPS